MAFSAVAILVKAQYGPIVPFWDEKIGQVVRVTDRINWGIGDFLIPPMKEGHWVEHKLLM